MGYPLNRKCSIKSCGKKHYAHGFCYSHWRRNTLYGNPLISKKNVSGMGSIRKDGYKLITAGGKRVYEHRFNMEQKLNRKLLSSENVHHIDGNKLNNHPNNLELISDTREHKLKHHSKFSSCWNCPHKTPTTGDSCRKSNGRWCKFYKFNYPFHKCPHGKFTQNKSFS